MMTAQIYAVLIFSPDLEWLSWSQSRHSMLTEKCLLNVSEDHLEFSLEQ